MISGPIECPECCGLNADGRRTTGPHTDLLFRPFIGDRWQGRGPAVFIADRKLRASLDELETDDPVVLWSTGRRAAQP